MVPVASYLVIVSESLRVSMYLFSTSLIIVSPSKEMKSQVLHYPNQILW